LNLLPDVQSKSQSLAKALNFPFPIKFKTEWEQFVQVINAIQNLPDIPLELIRYLSDKENHNVYEEWSKAYRQYLSVLSSILKDYNRNVLSINISATEIEWRQAQQSWFLPKWLQTRKIKKAVIRF
jgi:oligoendopeptidase F